jgi:hypothetical protein
MLVTSSIPVRVHVLLGSVKNCLLNLLPRRGTALSLSTQNVSNISGSRDYRYTETGDEQFLKLVPPPVAPLSLRTVEGAVCIFTD